MTDYTAPDPYAAPLRALAGTTDATPEAKLAQSEANLAQLQRDYWAAGIVEMESTRETLDADPPTPPVLMTAEEVASYAPPNPYLEGLKDLKRIADRDRK